MILNGSSKGVKRNLKEEEELFLLTKKRAVGVHISKHGETMKLFELAAKKINANPEFLGSLNGRTVNEELKRG